MPATLIGDTTTSDAREEVVRRADALRDRLWAGADEADRNRRIADADVDAVRAAGLLSLLTPSRFGGLATGARTFYEVTRALGRGCTSTGWVAGVLNTGSWMITRFPEQAQRDVWGTDPSAGVASVLTTDATATAVDGGLRVTGRWPYGSGSNHCGWAAVGVPGADPARSPVDLVLFPMSDVTVRDTWYVTGMRGTGSNTIVADDVFVPAHRIVPMADASSDAAAAAAPDTVHRAALAGLLPLSLLGTLVGAAEAALDVVVQKAPTRAVAYSTFTSQTRSPVFATDVAEAAARIGAAQQLGARVGDEMDDQARRGEMPAEAVRLRARLDCATAATYAREAVDLLVSAHGTSAFAEVSPLQRLWRDTAVGSRHIAFNARVVQQAYGHSLLGLDPRAVVTLI